MSFFDQTCLVCDLLYKISHSYSSVSSEYSVMAKLAELDRKWFINMMFNL